MGLTPLFTLGALFAQVDKFRQQREDGIKQMLASVGEEIVDYARTHPGYQDQTGNLKASLGYVVVLDNEIIIGKFEGDKPKGVQTAKDAMDEWIAENPFAGWRLVVTAGMQYAAAVESLAIPVLSHAVFTKLELLRHFKKELGL